MNEPSGEKRSDHSRGTQRAGGRPPRQTIHVMPDYVGRYVADSLPEIVKDEGEVELRLPRPTARREVFIVTFPSGNRFVLRAFAKKSRFERYAAAIEFTRDKAHLPLARGIRADSRFRTVAQSRRRICVEHFVEGAPLDPADVTSGQEEAIFRSLAALHAERSERWGPLLKLRSGSYRDRLLSSIGRVFQEITPLLPAPSYGEVGMWHGWFAFEIERMPEPKAFSLIHQHLVRGNILLSPDDSTATFLGNESLRFGDWAQDVEQVLALLARGDPGRRADLIARYMAFQTHLAPGTEYEGAAALARGRYILLRLRSVLQNRPEGAKVTDPAIVGILQAIREFVR